jgi:hypothetical protein
MAKLPSKSSIIERNAGMMNNVATQTAPPTGQPAMAPLAGQPLPQDGSQLAAGPDNINAKITDHQGNDQGPAAIKAGEIVFSVESVIGAGNGNYDKGAKTLLALHDKLQDHGAQIVQKQSIANPQASGQAPGQSQAPQGIAAAQQPDTSGSLANGAYSPVPPVPQPS